MKKIKFIKLCAFAPLVSVPLVAASCSNDDIKAAFAAENLFSKLQNILNIENNRDYASNNYLLSTTKDQYNKYTPVNATSFLESSQVKQVPEKLNLVFSYQAAGKKPFAYLWDKANQTCAMPINFDFNITINTENKAVGAYDLDGKDHAISKDLFSSLLSDLIYEQINNKPATTSDQKQAAKSYFADPSHVKAEFTNGNIVFQASAKDWIVKPKANTVLSFAIPNSTTWKVSGFELKLDTNNTQLIVNKQPTVQV